MIKHTHTEKSELNFSKLKERIMAVNDPVLGKFNNVREILRELALEHKPTLIVATGGSKVIAYYLQFVMERLGWYGTICEVIEPRDYFYKANRDTCFSNLIAISASGNTNGIEEVLTNFRGNGKKYLICEQEKEAGYEVISWGNELYEKEKSFISLANSLGPITLMLDVATSLHKEIKPKEIERINTKINDLLTRSKSKINEVQTRFKDTTLMQIMSGYDTKTSSSVLESNLVEVGLCAPVIHDKGSFCHGRSNLLFQYPNCHVIYLTHQLKELDKLLIDTIDSEYSNITVFNTDDLEENMFWKEYYLMLQMYFLSKKIADDKEIDLTMPEYNPTLVRKLYNFRGEM